MNSYHDMITEACRSVERVSGVRPRFLTAHPTTLQQIREQFEIERRGCFFDAFFVCGDLVLTILPEPTCPASHIHVTRDIPT